MNNRNLKKAACNEKGMLIWFKGMQKHDTGAPLSNENEHQETIYEKEADYNEY